MFASQYMQDAWDVRGLEEQDLPEGQYVLLAHNWYGDDPDDSLLVHGSKQVIQGILDRMLADPESKINWTQIIVERPLTEEGVCYTLIESETSYWHKRVK